MKVFLKTIGAVFLGLVWLAVFAKLVQLFFFKVWDFNPFNLRAWYLIPEKWGEGWVIDTAAEFFFFLAIGLSLPIFIAGLILILKFPWLKYITKPWKYAQQKKFIEHRIKLDAFPGAEKMLKDLKERQARRDKHIGKDKMPPPMDAVPTGMAKARKKPLSQRALAEEKQRDAMLKDSEAAAVQSSRFVEDLGADTPNKDFDFTAFAEEAKKSEEDKSFTQAPSAFPTFSAAKVPDGKDIVAPQELPQPTVVSRVDMKYETLMLAEQTGLRIVQDLKIGYDIIDFAILAKDEVYLINFEPVGSEWVADETGFEDDEPLWFSEAKYETSPVFKLNRAAKEFSKVLDDIMQDKEEKITVKKLFLIGGGAVLNYEDIKSAWDEQGVLAYRLSTGRPVEVPELFSFLQTLSGKGSNAEDVTDMIYTAFVAVEP